MGTGKSDYGQALISLLRLLGLLDKEGDLQLLDTIVPAVLKPKETLHANIRTNRRQIDAIVNHLVGNDPSNDAPYELVPGQWPSTSHGTGEPPVDSPQSTLILYSRIIGESQGEGITAGVARTTGTKEKALSLGLGANYYWKLKTEDQELQKVASIFLPLIKSADYQLSLPVTGLKELLIAGDIPGPIWLPSIDAKVSTDDQGTLSVKLGLDSPAVEPSSDAPPRAGRGAQKYTYNPQTGIWPTIRVATFCLVEWLARLADRPATEWQSGEDLYEGKPSNRLYHFLLPALGYQQEGATSIAPSPLVDFAGSNPDGFEGWLKSAAKPETAPNFLGNLAIGIGLAAIPKHKDSNPPEPPETPEQRPAPPPTPAPAPAPNGRPDSIAPQRLWLREDGGWPDLLLELTKPENDQSILALSVLFQSESNAPPERLPSLLSLLSTNTSPVASTTASTESIKKKIEAIVKDSPSATKRITFESPTDERNRIHFVLIDDSKCPISLFLEWDGDNSGAAITYGLRLGSIDAGGKPVSVVDDATPGQEGGPELRLDFGNEPALIGSAIRFGLQLLAQNIEDKKQKELLRGTAAAIDQKPVEALAHWLNAVAEPEEGSKENFELTPGIVLTADPARSSLGAKVALAPPAGSCASKYVDRVELLNSIEFESNRTTLTEHQHTNSLRLIGLRLGKVNASGDSFRASMLPNFCDMPGIDLKLSEQRVGENSSWQLDAKGAIAVQRKIGPVELSVLSYEAEAGSSTTTPRLSAKLDGQFELGPIFVKPYGLGLEATLAGTDRTPSLAITLSGLAVSLDTEAFGLEGMLREVGQSSYEGAATLRIAGLGGLTAFGGFGQVDGEASLYVFTVLNAPLGGPPVFFVTGLAGGFGYNRLLPPQDVPVDEHPFILALREGSGAINSLAGQFGPSDGDHWFAAGVKFRSLGLIEGMVVGVAVFGSDLRFQILGRACLDLDPLLRLGVDIQASASSQMMQMRAGVSSDSYVLHPDFVRPTGEMGMGVWYGSSENAGDFYYSFGGFIEQAKRPHYPSLNRLGLSASLLGFVRAKGEGFFALTPEAMMAGASLSLSATFEGIGAGLDAYAQVYMRYKPFFVEAQMGVTVWFQFCGRWEVSASLHLYSPPMGGRAEVSLDLWFDEIEFGFDFGADRDSSQDRLLTYDEFVTSMLGVPRLGNAFVALPSKGQPGLISFEVYLGLSRDGKPDEEQGLTATNPILVDLAFAIAIRSKVPVGEQHLEKNLDASVANFSSSGDIDLALCGLTDIKFKLELQTPPLTSLAGCSQSELFSQVPAAFFGAPNSNDLTYTAEQIEGSSKREPSVRVVEGFKVSFEPTVTPAEADNWPVKETEEESGRNETYPLPWASTRPPVPPPVPEQSPLQRRTRTVLRTAVPLGLHGRPLPGQAGGAPATAPRRLARPAGIVQTRSILAPWLGRTRRASVVSRVSGAAAAGVRHVPVPAPTQRSAWLQAVRLQLAPSAAPVAMAGAGNAPPQAPEALRARAWERGLPVPSEVVSNRVRQLSLPDGWQPVPPDQWADSPLTLTAGQVLQLQLGEERWRLAGQLKVIPPSLPLPQPGHLRPARWVRVLGLDAEGRPMGDQYLNGSVAAQSSGQVPAGTRQLVVIGQGRRSPVRTDWSTGIAEPVGIESSTRLLGLGRRSAAAHGCSIHVRAGLRQRLEPLTSYLGDALLRPLRAADLHWPAMPAGCSLLLQCAPRQGRAAPKGTDAPLRWTAHNATLAASGQRLDQPWGTSLVIGITQARATWALGLEVASGWRLAAVVCIPLAPAAVVQQLAGGQRRWIDDAQIGTDAAGTILNLELRA